MIVAHSGVSKAFSSYFNGINDGKFLNRGLKNCEITDDIMQRRYTNMTNNPKLFNEISNTFNVGVVNLKENCKLD